MRSVTGKIDFFENIFYFSRQIENQIDLCRKISTYYDVEPLSKSIILSIDEWLILLTDTDTFFEGIVNDTELPITFLSLSGIPDQLTSEYPSSSVAVSVTVAPAL